MRNELVNFDIKSRRATVQKTKIQTVSVIHRGRPPWQGRHCENASLELEGSSPCLGRWNEDGHSGGTGSGTCSVNGRARSALRPLLRQETYCVSALAQSHPGNENGCDFSSYHLWETWTWNETCPCLDYENVTWSLIGSDCETETWIGNDCEKERE